MQSEVDMARKFQFDLGIMPVQVSNTAPVASSSWRYRLRPAGLIWATWVQPFIQN